MARWNRQTNEEPREMLTSENKDNIIVGSVVCIVFLIIFGTIFLLTNAYNHHTEVMHKNGFAITKIYKPNGRINGSNWAKGNGVPIVLSTTNSKCTKNHDPVGITHDSAVSFLKNEMRNNNEA